MYLQGKGKQLTENKKNKKVVDKPLKKCYNDNVKKQINKLKGGILLWQIRLQREKLSTQC